ncbi:MAG: hypothetical protein ACI81P_000915 [Neolewinella sp.]|jgi:hypothetical protein
MNPDKKNKPSQEEEEPPVNAEEGTEDYYFENGLLVMSATFHRKRGFCCGNACKNCPYDHVNVTEK